MVSITFAIDNAFMERTGNFPWVNWSEVAREEVIRKDIFERYIKKKKLSKNDEKFCEENDWHPVDELPLREEFIKETLKAEKGPHTKMTLEELDKLLGLK